MPSPYTAETLQRITILRQKAAEGTITLEDMKEAVRLMRGDRKSAVTSSETKRRVTAKAAIPDADDMLNELGGLT